MNDLMTTEANTIVVPQFDGEAQAATERRVLERVKQFAITSTEDCAYVADVVIAKKGQLKRLEETRRSYVAPLNDATKAINAAFGLVTSVLEEIERVGKAGIAQWERAEQERVREAQRKADEAAAIERKRLAEEAAALEAQAKAAEAQAVAKPDSAQGDAAIQEAQELRAASFAVQAEVMTTRAAPVLAARIKGTSIRENWQAELTDKQALVKFIAANPEYLNLVDLNSSAAKAVAKVQKGNCQIPGLRVWDQGTVSMRAA
jgi:colicin import membrane protein